MTNRATDTATETSSFDNTSPTENADTSLKAPTIPPGDELEIGEADVDGIAIQPGNALATQHEILYATQGKSNDGAIADKSGVVSADAIYDPHEVLRIFYEKNKDDIGRPGEAIASALEGGSLGLSPPRVLVEGLDLLTEIHPFIEVAVVAFKLVTMVDLGQKPRVLMVKIQLQDMMSSFFQLRHSVHSDVEKPDARAVPELMGKIADAIKNCANVCARFMKEDFMSGMIKLKAYEQLLTEFVMRFRGYKDEVGSGHDGEHMPANALEVIFRRLDTPREHDVLNFLRRYPVKACITRNDTLADLVAHAKYSLTSFDRTGTGNIQRAIMDLKSLLAQASQEDVAEACKHNEPQLSRTLELLKQDLNNIYPPPARSVVGSILNAQHQMVDSITGGASKNISHGDLHALWDKQGWRGNVKGQNFALALNYYYTDHFQENVNDSVKAGTIAKPHPDQWTLRYLGVPYLRQIAEAADDDGAGYISVREANEFAARRPDSWSLPEWLAFCAAGWHTSVTWYRTRIYNILRAMVRVLQHVRPENLQAASGYLAGPDMRRVELVLRGTRPTKQPALEGRKLRILTDQYQKEETAKFEARLETLKYKLDNYSIAAITKSRRTEHFVYPILYLLLKRHFDIIRLACIHSLCKPEDEFGAMSGSIAAIFAAVDARKQKLNGILLFQFHLTSATHPRDPINNTIQKFTPDYAFKFRREQLETRFGDKEQQVKAENYLEYSFEVKPKDGTGLKFSFVRFCDKCNKIIEEVKTFCIQCMDTDGLATVDLCLNCFECEVPHDGMIHTSSHLLIKTTRPIHDAEIAEMIPESKSIAHRVQSNGFQDVNCLHCKQQITFPCWICTICSEDTYICKSCDAERAMIQMLGADQEHSLGHPLLWIHDCDSGAEIESTASDPIVTMVEARMRAMEEKLDNRLEQLMKALESARV
ncbi:hypothetical protein B0H12DRAFT_1126953 [Mycena haematopus]|nr:hypothetical protein B0H12DRAFT_1126953 [Mycena haematopus]